MKHNKRKKSQSLKGFHRSQLIIVLGVLVFLALGAITAISRQKRDNDQSATPATLTVASNKTGNLITVKVAGQNLQVDPQTGKIQPLSPQEAQQLADKLKGMLNRSTEGLVPVKEADGSISMDLQGRFQNVTVARVNQDGSISESCVDNPEAAANFFGIDPQLLGVQRASQPAKPVQANKNPIQ